jgi:hypothetical protein
LRHQNSRKEQRKSSIGALAALAAGPLSFASEPFEFNGYISVQTEVIVEKTWCVYDLIACFWRVFHAFRVNSSIREVTHLRDIIC